MEECISRSLKDREKHIKKDMLKAWKIWGKAFIPYIMRKYTDVSLEPKDSQAAQKIKSDKVRKAFLITADYSPLWCDPGDINKYGSRLRDMARHTERRKKGRPLTPLHLVAMSQILNVHLRCFLGKRSMDCLQTLWENCLNKKGEIRKTINKPEFEGKIEILYFAELAQYIVKVKKLKSSEVSSDLQALMKGYGVKSAREAGKFLQDFKPLLKLLEKIDLRTVIKLVFK